MSSKTPTSATCGLCSQLYTDPRMLQCLHTFCSKCLKKILGEQRLQGTTIKCPTCKKPTVVPKGNVAALTKDLRKSYEAEVAQIASKMHSKEEISCDQCVDTTSGPAVSFCVNCCDFLCKACAKHHKTWRKTLNHELQQVGSSKTSSNVGTKSLDNIPHKPMNCQLHEDETLKFYCEMCSTLICRDCMAIEHAGHKYDRIEKVAEKEKMHLVSLLRNVDDAKTKLDGAITKGSKVVKQVQAKQKAVEKDIQRVFKELSKVLATREHTLMAKAGEISLGKQTALTMQGEALQTLHKEIVEASEMITAATKVYTPAEMLSAKDAMAKKLEQLLKLYREANLEPCRSDAIPSMLGATEVIKHINSFGMVAGGSFPAEARTDLYIYRAIKGKQRKVVITACDISGKPFPYGGERVDAKLSLLGSQDLSCSVIAKIIDNNDGTYVTTFIPQKIGEHELSITIDGNHIKGSPFLMYIRQEKNYRSLTTAQKCFGLSDIPQDVAAEDSEVYVVVCGDYSYIEVFNQNQQRIRSIGYTDTVTYYGMSNVVELDEYSEIDKGAENIQFGSLMAIAIGGDILYVVDSGNYCVYKITKLGKFISKFGSRGSGKGQFSSPRGICLDNAGRVFVSDCGNNRVTVFEADGTFLYHIHGNAANGSHLNGPWGLAFDQCGNLHVADTNTSTIKVFTAEGKYVTDYNSGVNQPAGIAIDEEGNSFIVDNGYSGYAYGHGRSSATSYSMAQVYTPPRNRTRSQQSHVEPNQVCILNSKHNVIHSFGANQAGSGITIDKEGAIYICSSDNCQVHKY